MKNSFWGEIIISLVLITTLLFYFKPMYFLMPELMHPFMIPLLIILFLILAGFILKETPGDERSQLHKFISTRFAYFAGITTLFVAICFEALSEKLDIWLVVALCVMLFSKFIGLIYAYFRH
ncbi:MAG TPA: hypothetical protein VF189_03495 [Patescibacteria group bacterium]